MHQTINDFEEYIRKNGGTYTQWYAGVASDPKKRLFNDHNVNEHADNWIHSRQLGNDTSARSVEQHFLAKGCKGAPGGGDYTTCCAYAYKINGHTRE